MALLNNSFGSNKQNNKRMGVDNDNNDGDASNEKQSKTSSQNNREKIDTDSTSSSHPRKVLALSVERRPHEISQEVMIYFREITEACVGANETRRHEALENATLDPGLQPLLPHLMTFITEGVRINVTNHNLAILIYLMRLVKALIDNPHISLEPYLHLLVPTVITCVLNRQLCAKPLTDNHWALRDFAAKQLITLCNRHNTSSNELHSRVTRELSRALCSWIDGNASTNSTADTSCMKLSSVSASNEKNETVKNADDGKFSGMKFCKYDAGDRSIQLVNSPGTTANSSSSTGGGGGGIVGSGSTSNTTNGPSLGGAVHSMNTLYGILVALAEFGPQCLRVIVFPHLSSLCHRLTKLTESDPSVMNTTTNELNMHGSVDSVDMIKSKQQQQHPVLSLNLGCKLSPVDQRSFDSLKTLMTNRVASVLNDWRLRQGLGVTLEDYRSAYACLADCLFIANQNNNPYSTTTTTTNTVTPTTTSAAAAAAANTNTTNNNVTTTPGSINSSKPPQQSPANMNIVISSINNSSNNSTPVTLNTSIPSNSVTNPSSSSSGRIIVTSNIVPSNVNTSNA
ncbi:unnamed protein product [Trichobilharzia szidati]|nr:unnamed protein product [Trichobilharzia szidati]